MRTVYIDKETGEIRPETFARANPERVRQVDTRAEGFVFRIRKDRLESMSVAELSAQVAELGASFYLTEAGSGMEVAVGPAGTVQGMLGKLREAAASAEGEPGLQTTRTRKGGD